MSNGEQVNRLAGLAVQRGKCSGFHRLLAEARPSLSRARADRKRVGNG